MIGRRSTEQIALEQIKDFHLNLREVNLSGANLTADHSAKVDFRTRDLQRADLVNAKLQGASLQATKSTLTPVFAMPTVHPPVLGRSICQAQTFPKPKSTKCLATGRSPCPADVTVPPILAPPILAQPILAQPTVRITPWNQCNFIENAENGAQTPKPIHRHSPQITPQRRPGPC